ncbi:hypothetical protein Tco_0908506, partial [Tanacetum coccineum]
GFFEDIYGEPAISCNASKEVDIGRDKPLCPIDMLLYSWDEGLDVCVDLTGLSPLTLTGMIDFVPSHVVIEVAQGKHVKYEARCANIGYGFLPFSLSSFGELEKDALEEWGLDSISTSIELMNAVAKINDPQCELLLLHSCTGFGDWQWRLATLPFAFGGLGVYFAGDVLNYAFLASRLQSAELQTKLLRHTDILWDDTRHLTPLEIDQVAYMILNEFYRAVVTPLGSGNVMVVFGYRILTWEVVTGLMQKAMKMSDTEEEVKEEEAIGKQEVSPPVSNQVEATT